MKLSTKLYAATALALPLAFAATSGSFAQQAQDAAAEESGIEEMIVTSRRREETLQDIPVSISALNADLMLERGIVGVEDVGEFVPNLTLTTSDRSNNTRIVIRGIGGGFPDPTQSFGTGLYIDGIYIPNSVGGFMSTLDIERIEVLRGPQGTLFGKNSTGGVVNIITTRPGPDVEGRALVRVGSFGRRDARAMLNAPMSDTLFLRLSGSIEHMDGWYKNLADGRQTSGTNTRAFTGSMRWLPDDNWTLDASVQFSYAPNDNNGGNCIYNGPRGFTTRFHTAPGAGNYEEACRASEAAGKYKYFSDKRVFSDTTQIGFFGVAAWDSGGAIGALDNLGMKLSAASRKTTNDYLIDRDYNIERSDAVFTVGKDAQSYRQQNIEFIVDVTAMDERLDIVLGYNYFRDFSSVGDQLCWNLYNARAPGEEIDCVGAKGLFFEIAPMNELPFGPLPFMANIQSIATSNAGFGHATFSVTDAITLDAGIRYTSETRSFKNIEWGVTRGNFSSRNLLNDDTVALFGNDKGTWTAWTPMASISYKLPAENMDSIDDAMVYFTYSEGFQSGGFNTELNIAEQPLLAPLGSFDPERVETLEWGFKTTFADRRVRLNFSYFITDYRNKQEAINIDNTEGQFGGDPDIGIIDNVAKVDIQGFEIEFWASPVENLRIQAAAGYLDSKFGSFVSFNPDSGIIEDLSTANTDDFSPKWTLNANVEYTFPFANGSTLTPHIGLYYQSSFEHEAGLNRDTPPSACFQKAYTKWNARATWVGADDGYQFAVFGNNLGSKDIFEFCDVHAGRGATFQRLEMPASWGLEALVRF